MSDLQAGTKRGRPPIAARTLAWVSPEAVAQRLRGLAGFVWLDSERSASRFARWSYQAVLPAQVLSVGRARATLDGRPTDRSAIELMRSLFAPTVAARPPTISGGLPPLIGGWIGYMSYEFGEHTMPWRSPHLGDDATLSEFGRYPALIAWDHREKRCLLVALEADERAAPAAEALAAAHETALRGGDLPGAGWSMADLRWKASQTRAAFTAAIERTRAYIEAGDIYQANLAQCFTTRLPEGATPFEHYRMLRRSNPSPFAAFLDFPARAIGSTSPERFLAVSADGEAEARPIKGTIRIGATEEEDREAVRYLMTSEKERAENVMIVDLLRNDLSRVSRPHTVKTPDICVVETYEGLHHLVSSVTGGLKDGVTAFDAVCAAFPGGSITGAPKLRAMEIIAELEPQSRGIFCGSIGYVGADGTSDFNIAIRTVEYDGRDARLIAGGGVTHLSDPSAEYDETLLKAERVLGGKPS
jgi:para-aminobenzoate synthetase component 1